MNNRIAAVLVAMLLGSAALAQAQLASGEVTKLDKAAGRVTLKHGEIKNLDMPPMTMIFRVREPAMLQDIGVGDRVQFAAERVEGAYTVTEIRKTR